ncbi:unnamed protein product [Arctogadus glacialis]
MLLRFVQNEPPSHIKVRYRCDGSVVFLSQALVEADLERRRMMMIDSVRKFPGKGGSHQKGGQETLTGLTSCGAPDGGPDRAMVSDR